MAAAKLKEGASVKLTGSKLTGTVSSVEGDIATVAWNDAPSGIGAKVSVDALTVKK